MIITSLENKEVKYIDKLKQRKYRERERKFIIEGEHLIEEAMKNNLLERIVVVDGFEYSYDVPTLYVSPEVMKKISTMESFPSILGICNMLEEHPASQSALVLDTIQDPGNLGTMIRSSVAFNIDTVILSENTVDLYNPKVIRATQGMLFHINIIRRNLKEELLALKKDGFSIYTTNVIEGENIKNIKTAGKYALIVGNEGNGVRKEIAALSDYKIYIPMNSKVESLNVGVAASILLYEMGGRNG